MEDKHFTHLHLHTEFSLLDGAIRLKDLITTAQEQQWKAVGISDHGNVFGAVKFFSQARKAGIKPVLGCEMYFTPDARLKDPQEKYFHLLVTVQNAQGYTNLCKLFAFAYTEGFYFKPRIDYEQLEKHSEGLIIGSGCLGGHIPKYIQGEKLDDARKRIKWFQDCFGPDRFFLEVMPEDLEEQTLVNNQLFKLGKELGVRCVATGDAHYLKKEHRQSHEILLTIQTKNLFSDPSRFTFGKFQGHLKTTDEMLAAFPDHEEVVWNSGRIADLCDFTFETGKLFFPSYPVTTQETPEELFRRKVLEGLQNLKDRELVPHDIYHTYQERMDSEVDLIVNMGYVGYFLVVSDFMQWAKSQGIPHTTRGSAAGSLVAWCLHITNIDPIKYGLIFERFLNPERISMPDIDIDFCVQRREDVINYVKEKYGHDNVCQIITFGTMMAKGVIKDVARVLGFPFQDSNALTNLVPNQLKITLNDALEQEPKLRELVEQDNQVKNLIDHCFILEGITRHASKHAAGVVISPQPLREVMPLYVPPKTTDLITQYSMTDLEELGFLKMDFLGLTNLSVIDQTIKTIQNIHGIEIDLEHLPLDDQKTFDLFCRGATNAVFQFESEGIKEVLRKLQPETLEDLIAVNALYRPGPLNSGMIDDFIERRHGRHKTTYIFPELKDILAQTYGVIAYQEQVMKIASVIAGYSLGSADILRKAMGKKKTEVMEKQKVLFLEGAKKKGFNLKKAEKLFELMAYFAGYGFNKSHATAYALIAYQTAYLKAHYPAEFMASVISFETSNPDKMSHYLQEIQDLGLTTHPPDINTSHIQFTVEDGAIRFGLQGIKNIGDTALDTILKTRDKKKFLDLLDFCERVDLRVVNKRIIENLISAGAFDKLPGNRAQKIAELDTVIAHALVTKEADRTGQMGLFSSAKTEGDEEKKWYEYQPLPEWPEQEKLEREKSVIGFYLSSHPLKSYRHLISWVGAQRYDQSQTTHKKTSHLSCALLQSKKVITTKKGDRMAFLQCEDTTGNADIIVFPKLYTKVASLLDTHSLFLIKGTQEHSQEHICKIIADTIIPLHLLFEEQHTIQSVTLHLPHHFTQDDLEFLTQNTIGIATRTILTFVENDSELTTTMKDLVISYEHLQALEKKGFGIKISLRE